MVKKKIVIWKPGQLMWTGKKEKKILKEQDNEFKPNNIIIAL